MNRYAGFSLDDDEPLAEPGSLPPARGHAMVPKTDLVAARALADELAEALRWVTGDHYPEAHDDPDHLGEFIFTGFCDECAGDWPCETERRIRPALAKWEASKPRDPWQEAVDSPEMPGPGYDAQTRPLR